MHLVALQYDIVWENKPANHRLIEEMLASERLPRGAFVVLPELGDTGFSFDLDSIVDDRTLAWVSALARRLGVWIQAGHAIRAEDGMGRNCATIVGPDGASVATYMKVHPFSYGQESAHFGGGGHLVVRRCGPVAVAPLVCYDLRFPELWRLAALAGAEVFTIGASWPKPRQPHWRALAMARAIENQACVVAVNRIGRDPQLEYAGGSIIVSPRGDVLGEADDRAAVVRADLDVAALRAWRAEFPALRDIRRALLGSIEVERPIETAADARMGGAAPRR
jgi:predicted amidohydrolase